MDVQGGGKPMCLWTMAVTFTCLCAVSSPGRCHDNVGHQGLEITVSRLKERCFFVDVENCAKTFERYIWTKMPHPKIHAPVQGLLANTGGRTVQAVWHSEDKNGTLQATRKGKVWEIYLTVSWLKRNVPTRGKCHWLEEMFCPPANIGQLIFQRHSSLGRHKIKDAWGPTVIKWWTCRRPHNTVDPFMGGPITRVHRIELRHCASPVPKLGTKTRSQTSTPPVVEEGT